MSEIRIRRQDLYRTAFLTATIDILLQPHQPMKQYVMCCKRFLIMFMFCVWVARAIGACASVYLPTLKIASIRPTRVDKSSASQILHSTILGLAMRYNVSNNWPERGANTTFLVVLINRLLDGWVDHVTGRMVHISTGMSASNTCVSHNYYFGLFIGRYILHNVLECNNEPRVLPTAAHGCWKHVANEIVK